MRVMYIVSPLAGLGGGILWRPPAYSLFNLLTYSRVAYRVPEIDQQVAKSNLGRRDIGCNPGWQVVHAHVPQLPSSKNWYQRKLGR